MRSLTTSVSQTMTSTNWGMARGPTLTALRRRLLAWYRIHGRDLPWRRSDDPYHALVAEFMLQQTGVGRVLPAYEEFLRRFPTLQSLANARTSDVIRAWSGLGYNRRAVNLQRTARVIVEEHDGIIPSDPRTLATLAGIGPYTAAAISCFAFQRPVAVMDTNIRRVLGRILTGHTEVDADTGWTLAEVAVPRDGKRASEWHQALMDLGAMACLARRPHCDECPVNELCAARPLFDESRATDSSANSDSDGLTQIRYDEITGSIPKLRIADKQRSTQQGWIGTTRYYRGRIIDALRKLGGNGSGARNGAMSLHDLGQLTREDYADSLHNEWLRELLQGQERDGLVTVTGDTARLPE